LLNSPNLQPPEYLIFFKKLAEQALNKALHKLPILYLNQHFLSFKELILQNYNTVGAA